MDSTFFLRGVILGFAIAAPVGPIGVLTIQRTLAHGRITGFVTGLGAATADATYGAVAALGFTLVSRFFLDYQTAIRLGGAIFLVFLGARTFVASPSHTSREVRAHSLPGSYLSAFLLTLSNPLTILSFAAIYAGMGVGIGAGERLSALLLIAGVFTGSAAWWLILSTGVGLLQRRLNDSALRQVNRLSGLIILGFAMWIIVGTIGVW